MAQLVVRNIENEVKARIRKRAARQGRSMEEEVRDILRNAVKEGDSERRKGIGSRIAEAFAGIGLKKEIPKLRGYRIKPPAFDR
jgi:plasmid stability protein